MKQLRRNIQIFLLFTGFSLKTVLQARLGIVFFLLGKIIRFLLLLSLLFLIFNKVSAIKGYRLEQVIIFYLTFNIVDTLSQIIFREVYRFRPLVVSGNLDLILTKPYHPFLRILLGGVDFLDVVMVIPYFLLLLVFAAPLQLLTFVNIIWYLFLVMNGLVIACAFHIVALSMGILTTEVDHTMMIYRDITTLGRFPMEIYREPIRTIFTFFIPIGIMMAFPARALMNQLQPSFFVLSFAIALFSLIVSVYLWRYAIRKYQSWGG